MIFWTCLAVVLYLIVGCVFAVVLYQTPYRFVAHWAVVLWPLWLFGRGRPEPMD